MIHPEADEVCGDGIDNDCSGSDDDLDADADGYVSDDPLCGGDDCDDNDAAVNPDEFEVCGDGIDNDCSGSDNDLDADADGYKSDEPACGGDDCDDGNANIYPGSDEICDGYDNDCDGDVPEEETDKDGDGWMLCEADCDDSDPETCPSPFQCPDCERTADGVDNNCNGAIDEQTTLPCCFLGVLSR